MVTAVGAVVDLNEILLNSVRYPIKGPPRKVLTSLFAPKITIGETTPTAQQHISTIAWSDFRGGIGVERGIDATTVDRAWWGPATIRFKEHLLLPPYSKELATGPAGTVEHLFEFNSEIYGIFSREIHKYDDDTDTWTDMNKTLSATPTDSITVRMGGSVYIVIAWANTDNSTSGYSYATSPQTDGSGWTDDVKDAKYLTFWDDQLWGIDQTGLMWKSSSIGSETNNAQLPLPNDYVTDMFLGRDASGNTIIYVNTKVGLFAHDNTNTKLVETELGLPFHQYGGLGSLKWRDAIYFPVGLGVYKYKVGETATVTVVGPDLDHGLPADHRGTFKQLIGTHNDLIGVVDGTVGSEGAMFSSSDDHRSSVISSSGFSSVLAWNESAWQVLWVGGESDEALTAAVVSNAYDNYRLYFATTEKVYAQALSVDVINPNEVSDWEFEASGYLETPDFDADDITSTKLALSLKIQTEDITSDETVVVKFAKDKSSSFTTLTTISSQPSDGVTEILFGTSGASTTAPAGLEFKSIRFRVDLARGGGTTTTNASPDVVRMEFNYRRKLTPKFGWQITVGGSLPKGRSTYKGNTMAQLDSNLQTAISSNNLVSFTYRDNDTTKTHYVDVVTASGFEMTGHDERFERTIMLMEP